MYDIVFISKFNSRFILCGRVIPLPSQLIIIFNFEKLTFFHNFGKIDRRWVNMASAVCVEEQMEAALAYGDLTSNHSENIRIKLITLSGSFVAGWSYSECLSFHAPQPEHSIVTFCWALDAVPIQGFRKAQSTTSNLGPSYFLSGILSKTPFNLLYFRDSWTFYCR